MAREAHYPHRGGFVNHGLSGTQRVRIHTKRISSLRGSAPTRDARAVGFTACGPIPRCIRILTNQVPRLIKETTLLMRRRTLFGESLHNRSERMRERTRNLGRESRSSHESSNQLSALSSHASAYAAAQTRSRGWALNDRERGRPRPAAAGARIKGGAASQKAQKLNSADCVPAAPQPHPSQLPDEPAGEVRSTRGNPQALSSSSHPQDPRPSGRR
jgi:hypothetical protein